MSLWGILTGSCKGKLWQLSLNYITNRNMLILYKRFIKALLMSITLKTLLY